MRLPEPSFKMIKLDQERHSVEDQSFTGHSLRVVDASSPNATLHIEINNPEGRTPYMLRNQVKLTGVSMSCAYLSNAAQPGEWVRVMVWGHSGEQVPFDYETPTTDQVSIANGPSNPLPIQQLEHLTVKQVETLNARVWQANDAQAFTVRDELLTLYQPDNAWELVTNPGKRIGGAGPGLVRELPRPVGGGEYEYVIREIQSFTEGGKGTGTVWVQSFDGNDWATEEVMDFGLYTGIDVKTFVGTRFVTSNQKQKFQVLHRLDQNSSTYIVSNLIAFRRKIDV
ncbi:hypothetical protein KS4_16150 [Poriferisphaera corsica]|uniref:Uncharacterized protein n=1 Tax=Poriferisphaera corsica TaxID=2528020 RepID=A0A517YTL3_9BACT|nr:hypothetical protein [Poriferisphaera corsica]QDU33564.1 hypothetical protein KS4_16150 [Poriferisphaera corsica]